MYLKKQEEKKGTFSTQKRPSVNLSFDTVNLIHKALDTQLKVNEILEMKEGEEGNERVLENNINNEYIDGKGGYGRAKQIVQTASKLKKKFKKETIAKF